uniref:Hsp70 family protein n=1 Tax=Herbidospora sakaeratensis TaxID=564415 RepID=UPI000780FCE5|nr:Hsp70 family protein [Herbidospora sakaeratensis]
MTTFGIDLGTTYSCIAYVDDSGRAVIAKNAVGEDTTPSVVYFETADNVVVGPEAKRSALLDPDRVVSLVKRSMGQRLDLDFDGARHTPESVSAIILRELARAAAEQTRLEVRDVVITVPAHFGVAEREATRNAGKIAGLNVLNLVPEPVAAALHYEAITGAGNRTIFVYDLGGGTFDTTVLRIDGTEISVVCTDGDHRLGGADWDARIVDHLLSEFMDANPESAADGSEDFLQGLAIAAEEMKKGLSSARSRRHHVRFDGEAARVELSREEFEELTADLLERTFEITRRTVGLAAERGVTVFDDVLLVGGAGRMPAVAAGLREQFGFEAKLHDPDLAVAKGAARFALIESVKVRLPGEDASDNAVVSQVADQLGLDEAEVRMLARKRITTVVPRAFGVKVLKSGPGEAEIHQIAHVLQANTPLPAHLVPHRFRTVYPDQTAILVEIWEQAGAVASAELPDNTKIAEGLVSGFPPLPEHSPLNVTFSMDELGTLRVHAVELTTGKDLRLEVRIEGLSAAEVGLARDTVARYDLRE